MGIGYILLILFAAYATLQFWKTQRAVKADLSNRASLRPGVSYYCNLAVSQRPAQVLAAQAENSCMVSETGYAPAFGPNENMPSQGTELYT